MTGERAIDLVRESLRLSLMLGGPLLAITLVAGLVSAMLQTATQVHDPSLSFVPKLAGVVLTLAAALPWLLAHLVEYTQDLISTIPLRL